MKGHITVKCMVCHGENRNVEVLKPGALTPSITKILCGDCESTLIIKVSKARRPEHQHQITIETLKLKPSAKALKFLEPKGEP